MARRWCYKHPNGRKTVSPSQLHCFSGDLSAGAGPPVLLCVLCLHVASHPLGPPHMASLSILDSLLGQPRGSKWRGWRWSGFLSAWACKFQDVHILEVNAVTGPARNQGLGTGSISWWEGTDVWGDFTFLVMGRRTSHSFRRSIADRAAGKSATPQGLLHTVLWCGLSRVYSYVYSSNMCKLDHWCVYLQWHVFFSLNNASGRLNSSAENSSPGSKQKAAGFLRDSLSRVGKHWRTI